MFCKSNFFIAPNRFELLRFHCMSFFWDALRRYLIPDVLETLKYKGNFRTHSGLAYFQVPERRPAVVSMSNGFINNHK